ncbi:MAG: DNA polymerase III subunit delta [Candidatus Komeilibacteria bacterium]
MIFFFYGEDTYRSYQKVKQIRDKFREEVDTSGFNTLILEGPDLNLEKFNTAVTQAGFLSNKRLIIIKNLFNNKSLATIKDDIIAYLNKQTDSAEENFLLFWQDNKPDKRSGLYKKLISYKYVQEFEPLNNSKLNNWALAEFNRQEAKITKPALTLLIASTGNNLWQLSTEIAKLAAYKKGQTIIEQDIELMTHGKLDENIFKLTDAIANQNRAQALKLMNGQLAAGVNEQYLLTMILRQYRILLQLKSLINNHTTNNELAKQAGLHPFVVQKSLPLLSKYSANQLKTIYHTLTELDLDLKISPINNETLLDLFIVKN